MTNPANSAKLAAVLPAAAHLAADRRDPGQDQPAAQARPAAEGRRRRDHQGRGRPQPRRVRAELSQTVRAALDPLWQPQARRQGGARRRVRQDRAAAGEAVRLQVAKRPGHGCARVRSSSPRSWSARPSSSSCRCAWCSGTACTSGTSSPTPSSSSAPTTTRRCWTIRRCRSVLRATGIFSVGLVVFNLSLALLLAVLLNQRLRGHRGLPDAVLLPGRRVPRRLDDRVGLPAAVQRRHQRPARRGRRSHGPELAADRPAPRWCRWSWCRCSRTSGSTWCCSWPRCRACPASSTRPRSWTARRAWTRFRRITLPLISPTILLTSIITVVGSLQVFAQIAVLTQGGPGTSTTVLVYYLYQQAFQFHHFGYGSTLADPAVRHRARPDPRAVAAAPEVGLP